jgi:hypothetical protein
MVLIFGFLWWGAGRLLSDFLLTAAQILIGLLVLIWILGLLGIGPGLVFV